MCLPQINKRHSYAYGSVLTNGNYGAEESSAHPENKSLILLIIK